MAQLFLFAGISTKFSLKKRTTAQFFKERVSKVLLPVLWGIPTVVAILAYIADKFHNGYQGNFFQHYSVFFTRFTDFTGYDGGFTPGHLWFLVFLFVISVVGMCLILLQKRFLPNIKIKKIPILAIYIFGVLPALGFIIFTMNGNKGPISTLILYLAGYYIFSREDVMNTLEKYRLPSLIIFLIANFTRIYCYIWMANGATSKISTLSYLIAMYFGILTCMGYGKKYFNQSGKVFSFLSKTSFDFYIFHFPWVVFFQYIISKWTLNIIFTYGLAVILAFICTFATVYVKMRITDLIASKKPQAPQKATA